MALVQRFTCNTGCKVQKLVAPQTTSLWGCQRYKQSLLICRRSFLRGKQAHVQSSVVRGMAAATQLATGPKLDLAKMEPLGDRILVKPLEESMTSAGGIIMSTSSKGGAAIQDAVVGEVLAVGGEVDIKVSKGDKIVYSKYSTSDVSVPDGDVTFVAQKSVLATLS